MQIGLLLLIRSQLTLLNKKIKDYYIQIDATINVTSPPVRSNYEEIRVPPLRLHNQVIGPQGLIGPALSTNFPKPTSG